MRRIIYIILGLIGLGLGAVAAALPLLPAFPFLLLAAFSFARSSDRLYSWYLGTRLYKNNIGPFIKGQGMTWSTKIKTMVLVTLSMSIGFVMLSKILVGQIILSIIWILHIIYFIFGVRTMDRVGKQAMIKVEEA